jgi:Cu-Zn family superoxide dismutase
MRYLAGLTIVVLATTQAAPLAQPGEDGVAVKAELKDASGRSVGQASLRQAGARVLVTLTLDGLPAGTHAMHLHETGACEPPDFESAGGHFAPAGHAHGLMAAAGAHAGDLPNIHVGPSRKLTVEVLVDRVSLTPDGSGSLLDGDGSAIVLHEGSDDYASQPSGDAGPPIACGVITR